jgi:3-oxoacyl-[acyl-carrier-protein] synthase II
MSERIVITGLGTVNALGNSVDETWGNILKGVSGLGPITLFDSTDHLVHVACEAKNFDPTLYMDAREVRRRDRYELFSAAAVAQAITHSGLQITEENAPRIGTVISAAIGGIGALEEGVLAIKEGGPRRASPFLIPMLMPNGAAGLVGIDHGPKGPALSVASACASGQDGIGMAWLMLKAGLIDVAVAGAAEAAITMTAVAAFDRMQAMSRRTEGTPSPFDSHRDGLVIGEGAAVMILEKESHAKARGAEILAEVAGYSSSADAHHITAPHAQGAGGSQAIRNALDSAKLTIEDVDYINAHGTGTSLNDLSETRAIKAVFGEQAYKVPVSSTKSMTGHMMGATGALEAIFCALAIRDSVLPPTINYVDPDPECDLDYVPNQARQANIDVAMTNAFGFGGHNAVLVIRKYH